MTHCKQIDNYMVATDLEYTNEQWEAIRADLQAVKGRALGITSYLLSTKLRSLSTTTKTPIHTIHEKHKEEKHTL